MEADFSGWATKAGLQCSDGRTIMPNAFRDQDQAQVPLVWQHGHSSPNNVLGHAVLENRPEGVYAHCFFNETDSGKQAKALVIHKDVNMLSIWASGLVERSKKVLHGAIKEVSLVLSGANPGALIENVTIRHSDGSEFELEDEIIIYSGEKDLEFAHSDDTNVNEDEVVEHAAKEGLGNTAAAAGADDNEKTVQDVYDSMTAEQKDVVHFFVGEALDSVEHSDIDDGTNNNDADTGDKEGDKEMTHTNVFEGKNDTVKAENLALAHAAMGEVLGEKGMAMKSGSLKEAMDEYTLAHGITDIDTLFPDAKTITDLPEFLSRRNEWVANLLNAVRKSPFSRIKTVSADITLEQARAKGYIKAAMKKEEFFPVVKRVTIPSTIYKKQKLDRDDIIDITDFDVVMWIKGEMRIMLDEEIARAILISDGRDVSDEDKINEQNVRPISKDNELYTTVVNVNINDSNSSIQEVIDAIITNRSKYKGSGTPTLYTTEIYIARFMLLKDGMGRRIYRTLDELATELRVKEIVPVEPMEEEADVVAIIVNPIDYVVGADKGGNISMFDDFDIDYNQYKYLIETRMSGALTKLKSAIVVKSVAGNDVLVVPNPDGANLVFNDETGALTVTTQTGVVFKHGATTLNTGGSPYTVPAGQTWVVDATPAAGYFFNTSDDDQWSFTADEA